MLEECRKNSPAREGRRPSGDGELRQSITFSPRQFTELYARNAHDELSERFLDVLRYFEANFQSVLDDSLQRSIDAFVLNFLHLFSQADYVPNLKYAPEFIKHNPTLANLAALSVLKTTDPYLEIVRYQPNNLVKVLTLYSARNSVKFDRHELFRTNASLAASWYLAYGSLFHSGLLDAHVSENLKEHYAFQPAIFDPSERIADLYYGSSYLEGDCDRPIKTAINQWLQRTLETFQVRNKPDPKKIAVLSCLWWRGVSNHRTNSAYVEALRDYDLTLFHVPMGWPVDTTHFREVKELSIVDGRLDAASLLDNDFALAFFPDIGMTSFSIWLANLRIAPIQVAATGHSVSTWGAKIDYYMSGADVETPDHPERYYSERLVLLPGCGAVHNAPDYKPIGRVKSVPEFVINCPWSAQKVNYRFAGLLRQIVERADRPLRFRFFVGTSLKRHADYMPFVRELSARLAPAVVEVLPNLGYKDYMAFMEEGDMSMDAYPYGGCNTMADSLHLGKLMVAFEGDRWYNRIGPRMLRMIGLDELVASSDEGFIDLVLRLIRDDAYRSAIEERLLAADLQGTIFSRAEATSFRKAIEYLIANHERLERDSDRSPIRIEVEGT
jgi:hypothetical protein